MAAKAKRDFTPHPLWTAPPGFYAHRLEGDVGSMVGSFIVWGIRPEHIVLYQTKVFTDADLAMMDAEGESRLDLLPLVLRAIREARDNDLAQ